MVAFCKWYCHLLVQLLQGTFMLDSDSFPHHCASLDVGEPCYEGGVSMNNEKLQLLHKLYGKALDTFHKTFYFIFL